MSTRGKQALYQRIDSLSTRWRHSVYQMETLCLPEEDRLSTRGRQPFYQRETGCHPEGDRGCLPDGDRMSTRGRLVV